MKRKLFNILFFVGVLIFISCNEDAIEVIVVEDDKYKEIPRDTMTMDVSLSNSNTYTVGSPIVLSVDGNVELISLYTGKRFNDYNYILQDRNGNSEMYLSFESSKQSGEIPFQNIPLFDLYYSTDYAIETNPTTTTIEEVKSATWIPITSLFNIQNAMASSNTDFMVSGVRDISGLFDDTDSTFYLAFRGQTLAGSKRTAFVMRNVLLNGTNNSILYNQSEMNFQWVENQNSKDQIETSRPTITPNFRWFGVFSNDNGPYKEGYAITKKMTIPKVNLGRDKPIVLIHNLANKEYTISYDKVGSYDIVLLGSRTNSNEPEIIRRLNVTIVP